MPKEEPSATVMTVELSLSVRVRSEPSVAAPRDAVMVVTCPSVREESASSRETVVTSSSGEASSEMVTEASAAVLRSSKPPPEKPVMERVSVISALV